VSVEESHCMYRSVKTCGKIAHWRRTNTLFPIARGNRCTHQTCVLGSAATLWFPSVPFVCRDEVIGWFASTFIASRLPGRCSLRVTKRQKLVDTEIRTVESVVAVVPYTAVRYQTHAWLSANKRAPVITKWRISTETAGCTGSTGKHCVLRRVAILLVSLPFFNWLYGLPFCFLAIWQHGRLTAARYTVKSAVG
jgi:hypothetical protein